MKKLIFVLLAGLLVAVTILVLWPMPEKNKSPQVVEADKKVEQQAVVPRILVAKYTIQAGSLLRAEDFRWAPMVENSSTHLNDVFLEGFIKPDVLKGSLLTRSLTENQPLAVSDIIRPEQNQYMSAMLSPNMRAVTIEMPLAGMNYDLLRPGNYVDVILTSVNDHTSENGFGAETKRASSVILQNVRLLAINNMLTDIVTGPKKETKSSTVAVNGASLPVTFEVTPEDAQRLLLARTLGDLSLILLGYQQDSTPTVAANNSTLWDEQLSDNHNPARKPGHAIRIFNGEEVNTQERTIAR